VWLHRSPSVWMLSSCSALRARTESCRSPTGLLSSVLLARALEPLHDLAAGGAVRVLEALPEAQALHREHLLDLFEARLAEVLVAHQLGLGDAEQIAERADVHLLQAGPGADGELEVGHRGVEQGATLEDVAVVVLLDDHLLARQHVLHEQAGPLVVRVGVEHLAQAALGADVVALGPRRAPRGSAAPGSARAGSRSSARTARSPRPPRPAGRAGRRAGTARPSSPGPPRPPCASSRCPRPGRCPSAGPAPARTAWSIPPRRAEPTNPTRSPCQEDRPTSIPRFSIGSPRLGSRLAPGWHTPGAARGASAGARIAPDNKSRRARGMGEARRRPPLFGIDSESPRLRGPHYPSPVQPAPEDHPTPDAVAGSDPGSAPGAGPGSGPDSGPDLDPGPTPDAPPRFRYKLTLAYEGTDFHGWQKQEPPASEHPELVASTPDDIAPGRVSMRTVQDTVERAVRTVLRERVNVKGASRTDSGVHAGGTLPRSGRRLSAASPAGRSRRSRPSPTRPRAWAGRSSGGRTRSCARSTARCRGMCSA
jgi:hypothetical protein